MRSWIDCFVILILSIFFREYYLQYTNFLSPSDKKSAIVSTTISVHTSEKQEEIKTVSRHKTPSLIGPLMKPELAKWLR